MRENKNDESKSLKLVTKNERGITLIALIITIIVMLILVAVTVKTVVDSGLFGHAKNATKNWAEAQEQEIKLGDNVDEILSQYEKKEHNWQRNGDDIHCEHCNLSFVIGDYVDYKPDMQTTKSIVTAKEIGLPQWVIDEAIAGGMEVDQTIVQDSKTKWRVIGVEDSDKDGKNEGLLIKMATPTTTNLVFYGKSAYNDGTNIMNRVCRELYSSKKYGEARSINIDDVNNALEYTQNGGIYTDGENWYEVDGFDVAIKDAISSKQWENIVSKGTYTPDGTNTEEKLGNYKLDTYCYFLDPEENKKIILPTEKEIQITERSANVIFFNEKNDMVNYWLATKSVYVTEDTIYFSPGAVITYCVYSNMGGFFNSMNVESTIDKDKGYPLCPVVSLKSEIPDKIEAP